MKLSDVPIEFLRVGDRLQSDFNGKIGHITRIEYLLDIRRDTGRWKDDHIIHVQFTNRNYGEQFLFDGITYLGQ